MNSYYTCGQEHYRQNPNWKPWQHLEAHCDDQCYDFFEARDLIFERIGRELECECQFLRDDEAIERRELEAFGVDVRRPGKREVDLIYRSPRIWPNTIYAGRGLSFNDENAPFLVYVVGAKYVS